MEHYHHEPGKERLCVDTCNHVREYDPIRGEYVCRRCGLVLKSNVIDYRPETEVVCYESIGNAEPPSVESIHIEHLLDTYNRSGHGFEVDQTITETLRKLDRNYPDFVADTRYFYRMCENRLGWNNRMRDSRVGSIAMVVSEIHHVPLDPEKICEVCRCSENLIRNNCQELVNHLKNDRRFEYALESSKIEEDKWIFPNSRETEEFQKIAAFCDNEKLNDEIRTAAMELLTRVISAAETKIRTGTGAACLKIVSQNMENGPTIMALSKFFKNDRNTIKARIKEIGASGLHAEIQTSSTPAHRR